MGTVGTKNGVHRQIIGGIEVEEFKLIKTLLEKDILSKEEKREIQRLMNLVEEQKIEILGLEGQLKDAFFEGPYYRATPKGTFDLKN